MRLFDWWLEAPERLSPNVPALLKAALVPWVAIGSAFALIPDLQQMPDLLRAVIGLPLAVGILWMAIGMLLKLADKSVAFGSYVRRHTRKAN